MPPDDDTARFEAAKARFLEGLACLESGRAAEAEPHFLASLALLPGRASTLVNLAATQLQLGKLAEALHSASQVLATTPDDLDALFHRGTALARLGRPDEALPVFERLLALDERRALGWLLHGQVMQDLGRVDAALASYDRATALAPTLWAAWSNRGSLLRELQRPREAAQAFEQALAHGGDPVLLRYYLAAVGAGEAPGRSPADYVQGLFDQYAEGFDEHLVQVLRYGVPQRLAKMVRDALGEPPASPSSSASPSPSPSSSSSATTPAPLGSALDLGCGTGLCGPLLRPLVRRLVGLDLSAGMLAQSRERGVYDALVQADLLAHLKDDTERHDLVVAADVFIYFGDLAPVFAGVQRVLRPGGWFAFSVEQAPPGASAYVLQPSLRYAHAEAGLRALAAMTGFEPMAIEATPIREEQAVPIPGSCWLLRRR